MAMQSLSRVATRCRGGQDGFEKGTQDFVAMLESRLTGAGEEIRMELWEEWMDDFDAWID